MIGRLNHIAIATPNIMDAAKTYTNMLGAEVSNPIEQIEHGVSVIFINLPNTKIELLEPLGKASPIINFLNKNPNGGIHHICYEVENILEARDQLIKKGATILGTGEPMIGAHGKLVIFVHPKDFNGTLIELEQSSI